MLMRLMKFLTWTLIITGTSGQSLPTYQKTTIEEITSQKLQTSQMRAFPLTSVFIGPQTTEGSRHKFLVQGGLHGNETLTVEFVEWLAQRVKQGLSPLNRLPAGSTIDFLPQANPDAYGISRYNSNNVNLNRNFGVLWGVSSEPHGDKAFSEPETQAIRMLMQSRRYLAAVDIHGYVNWIVAPTPPELLQYQNNPMNRLYRGWLQEIKRNLKVLPGYKVKKAALLGDGGSFEDWAFWENQTMSLCLEMKHPQRFEVTHIPHQRVDSFYSYENYIHLMFVGAINLNRQLNLHDSKVAVEKESQPLLAKEQKGH